MVKRLSARLVTIGMGLVMIAGCGSRSSMATRVGSDQATCLEVQTFESKFEKNELVVGDSFSLAFELKTGVQTEATGFQLTPEIFVLRSTDRTPDEEAKDSRSFWTLIAGEKSFFGDVTAASIPTRWTQWGSKRRGIMDWKLDCSSKFEVEDDGTIKFDEPQGPGISSLRVLATPLASEAAEILDFVKVGQFCNQDTKACVGFAETIGKSAGPMPTKR
jgi:hypothetical protein